jgi:hypothetical protein
VLEKELHRHTVLVNNVRRDMKRIDAELRRLRNVKKEIDSISGSVATGSDE